MKRIIIVFFLILVFLFSVPGYADKPSVRPILYTYYRQLGWGDSVQIGYVDSNGNLWALKGNDSELEWPGGRENQLRYLEEKNFENIGKLDYDDLFDLKSLVGVVKDDMLPVLPEKVPILSVTKGMICEEDGTLTPYPIYMKRMQPEINIIFVTAYDHYYAEAMQMHASGYLVKPLREEELQKELQELRRPVPMAENRLFARAFGDFEVFYNDKPLLFRYQKTKEMFAYLIDRRGAMVTSEALITVLWGGEVDRSNFFKQVRKDLNDTLAEIGYDDILLRRRGALGLLIDRISCDYYDWLQGLPSGINAYHGEYMRQYDWAESTWVNLEGKTNLWE